MYSNTPDFALNGILANPVTKPATLQACVAEVSARLEAGTLSLNMKEKLVHNLTQVKERLDG